MVLVTRQLLIYGMRMLMKFVNLENLKALSRFIKWWIHVQLNLNRRLHTFIQLMM